MASALRGLVFGALAASSLACYCWVQTPRGFWCEVGDLGICHGIHPDLDAPCRKYFDHTSCSEQGACQWLSTDCSAKAALCSANATCTCDTPPPSCPQGSRRANQSATEEPKEEPTAKEVPPENDGRCASAQTPMDTRCTGCPPMLDGKLCASTTRYNDQTKGACGCGNSDPVPPTWWTKTKYTAAMNAKNLDPASPSTAWCPSQCGSCFKLCSTGGTTQGKSTNPGVCRVFKVENRCGDGFDPPQHDYWCSNRMTYQECQQNPGQCATQGNTNEFGYPAHFDLQDLNGQIGALGWDNVEVTFEPVSCSEWSGPSWDCQCPSAGFIGEDAFVQLTV